VLVTGGWPNAAWPTFAALGVVAMAALFLHRREKRKVPA